MPAAVYLPSRIILHILIIAIIPVTLAGQTGSAPAPNAQCLGADFYCTFDMPDSLGLNQNATDVEPNPFTISYSLENVGNTTGIIRKIILWLPQNMGLSLNPASPMPLDSTVNLAVDVNETATFTWLIDVEKWAKRRTPQIVVVAYDDTGGPWQCDGRLPIVAVSVTGIDRPAIPDPALAMFPNPVRSVLSVEVSGLQNTPSELLLTDMLGRQLQRIRIEAGVRAYRLDLTGNPPGAYFLELRSESRCERKMLLKR